jgi:hypothetical protein
MKVAWRTWRCCIDAQGVGGLDSWLRRVLLEVVQLCGMSVLGRRRTALGSFPIVVWSLAIVVRYDSEESTGGSLVQIPLFRFVRINAGSLPGQVLARVGPSSLYQKI